MVKIVLGKPKPQVPGAPPSSGGGLFGSKQSAPQIDAGVKEEVSSINRRLKLLEERYTNIRSKSQLMEQNMLQKNKSLFNEIKTINLELSELKKEITEIKDKILIILKETDGFARKEHVDILKKYIDLWSPMNFVSRNEIEDLVLDALEKIRKDQIEKKV